jgi:hypothetical protein
VKSQEWALTSLVSATKGPKGDVPGLGPDAATFMLENMTSHRKYAAAFGGIKVGGGGKLSISISIPSASNFRSRFRPVCATEFTGMAMITELSITIGRFGFAHARLLFGAVDTKPADIDIGGGSVGSPGAGASVKLAEGLFVVVG